MGRCDLLLLDSNVEGNAPEDRELTSRLYGGDGRTRIRQELLLGVGGFRALKAMGISPGVLHLNEGHSGFAVFEAIRNRMEEEGIDFNAAASQIPREVIFTTHTPVPAGHDRFSADLIEEHLGPLREQLGISHDNLMGFGREYPTDHGEQFCMTVLGLKLSRRANAVRRCMARYRAPCGRASIRAGRKTPFPSATSPTACMCRPGWRRRCAASTIAISAWAGRATAAPRAPGKRSRMWTTASCGRRT